MVGTWATQGVFHGSILLFHTEKSIFFIFLAMKITTQMCFTSNIKAFVIFFQ